MMWLIIWETDIFLSVRALLPISSEKILSSTSPEMNVKWVFLEDESFWGIQFKWAKMWSKWAKMWIMFMFLDGGRYVSFQQNVLSVFLFWNFMGGYVGGNRFFIGGRISIVERSEMNGGQRGTVRMSWWRFWKSLLVVGSSRNKLHTKKGNFAIPKAIILRTISSRKSHSTERRDIIEEPMAQAHETKNNTRKPVANASSNACLCF